MNEMILAWVRPTVTIAFTLAFIYGFVMDKISGEVFTATVTMVIVYWFRSRDEEKAVAAALDKQ